MEKNLPKSRFSKKSLLVALGIAAGIAGLPDTSYGREYSCLATHKSGEVKGRNVNGEIIKGKNFQGIKGICNDSVRMTIEGLEGGGKFIEFRSNSGKAYINKISLNDLGDTPNILGENISQGVKAQSPQVDRAGSVSINPNPIKFESEGDIFVIPQGVLSKLSGIAMLGSTRDTLVFDSIYIIKDSNGNIMSKNGKNSHTITFDNITASVIVDLGKDKKSGKIKVINYDGTYDVVTFEQEERNEVFSVKTTESAPQENNNALETSESLSKLSSNAPHIIADALREASRLLGGKKQWKFLKAGERLGSFVPLLEKQLNSLKDIITSVAQKGGVDKVNQFLKQKGFSIQLKPDNDPNSISVASTMILPVSWDSRLSAKPSEIFIYEKNPDGKKSSEYKTYPGVEMRNVKEIYYIDSHNHPIIGLDTNSKDKVYITRFEGDVPFGQTGIHDMISKWRIRMDETTRKKIGTMSSEYDYTGTVKFPMVDYDRSGNIEELLGANIDGAVISQAKFQHILKMNDKGAIAKAAAAIGVTRSASKQPQDILIDGSFVVWFERPGEYGKPIVVFSAIITKDEMKDPGNLN